MLKLLFIYINLKEKNGGNLCHKNIFLFVGTIPHKFFYTLLHLLNIMFNHPPYVLDDINSTDKVGLINVS